MVNNDDTDMDENSPLQAKTKGRKVRPFIVVSLAIAASAVAGLYFGGSWGPLGSPREAGSEQPDQALRPALYLPLEPPFIVNFDDDGDLGYLQVAATVMTHDPAVIEAMTVHMPYVRNNLILLLGHLQHETLATLEGKERLRAAMLEEIAKALEQATGKAGAEAVYFTSFVMQ